MTVAAFIDWLKTQNQDAIVHIVEHTSGRGYYDQGGNAKTTPFDPAKHAELTDFRGNQYVKPTESHYNTIELLIGQYDG